MAIDHDTEHLIPLYDVPKRVNITPRPHLSTVHRWADKGIKQTGRKLDTVWVGGRRYTSEEELQRFLAPDPEPEAPAAAAPAAKPKRAAGRHKKARARAKAKAARKLKRARI